jgi:ketosteroid isomerase-like protein
MSERTNHEVLERMFELFRTGEMEALTEVFESDCVMDYPQSGERVMGVDNIAAILTNYPGGHLQVDVDRATVIGDEERYILTPTFNVVRVQGTGDTLVGTVRTLYPDGTYWYVISVSHFRGGRIVRTEMYFAPQYEAPTWRAQWVEPLPAPDHH